MMTNEEAIRMLVRIKERINFEVTDAQRKMDALNIAIKALEQTRDCRSCKKWDECPCGKEGHENGTSIGYSVGECRDFEQRFCDDCISREDAIKTVFPYVDGDLIADAIKRLPSVTPHTRWIPVSERLPEEYIHVLCQFTLSGMGECYLAHGVFHIVGGLVMNCNEVIAWMPLPQRYSESEDKVMTNEEKYHTCGRCKWENTPYICHHCKWEKDTRKDLWKSKEDE